MLVGLQVMPHHLESDTVSLNPSQSKLLMRSASEVVEGRDLPRAEVVLAVDDER